MKKKKPIAESIRTKGGKTLVFFLSELTEPCGNLSVEQANKEIAEVLASAGIDTPFVVMPHGVSRMEILS